MGCVATRVPDLARGAPVNVIMAATPELHSD